MICRFCFWRWFHLALWSIPSGFSHPFIIFRSLSHAPLPAATSVPRTLRFILGVGSSRMLLALRAVALESSTYRQGSCGVIHSQPRMRASILLCPQFTSSVPICLGRMPVLAPMGIAGRSCQQCAISSKISVRSCRVSRGQLPWQTCPLHSPFAYRCHHLLKWDRGSLWSQDTAELVLLYPHIDTIFLIIISWGWCCSR